MTGLVVGLLRHYADGLTVNDDLSVEEKLRLMEVRKPSPLTRLTWICDSKPFALNVNIKDGKSQLSLSKLPDSSGFICFERDWVPNNCLLLDAYGKERVRLTVPVELSGSTNPDSAKAPTSFENVSEPYTNPTDGRKGRFGVTAWIEHAGKYYFELDYRTGKFLWGKAIRD